ncbi:uncharacterized protein LOC110008198 [Amborella trichopoda]|uniref:uncharacterized protein LOC110008198 n=1 Tax=Amborella trichopoda TaxID=13333 RepID=UPI0009C0651F|nr:uncharacterized protein LOC110008198 [Amborella trichopoda]|eukprot:XP_020529743.1 uncharacterized protein LOC110008198 [Amborella trichopoda]
MDTPSEVNHKLHGERGELLKDPNQYQRIAGILVYLTINRPDISYGVNLINQFIHALHKPHLDVVYKILRYLKSAPGKGMFYSNRRHPNVVVYIDADWDGCQTDRRSTTGYCTFILGNSVTLKNKKQNVVARSSVET